MAIKNIFLRLTKKPVTPKELRKMHVTYLKDIGASEAELKAAAWMHHSRTMQSKIYDHQQEQDKLVLITAFNERIMAKVFNPQAQ